MLLIHVPRLTNRLGYTLNVIFRHILKTDFEITVNLDIFTQHQGPKLCYGTQQIGDALFIRSSELLFQTNVEDQNPKAFVYNDVAALFPVYNAASALPFDIFAATFYCLSRYEEYLPHFSDKHGRFPATESIAFKEGFLLIPVVDRWALIIADIISQRYPEFSVPTRYFSLEDTFDIDAAYCYKNKGISRTVVGVARDMMDNDRWNLLRHRFRVIMHKEADPFDCFDYVIGVHDRYSGMKLKFFPLMADYNVYDKPISYQNREFRDLLQHLCDYAKMGLHASYASASDNRLIGIEKERLATVLHRKTVRNRFHFLLLTLPESYNALLENEIYHDYTMGYADEPGFRAGTCTPFPFFDLESDCETQLTVHPFAAMDSTLYYYKKMTADEAENIYRGLVDEVKRVGGTISLLWHNQTLSEQFGWEGWRRMYENVIDYCDKARKS